MNTEFYVALFVGIIFMFPIVPRMISQYSKHIVKAKLKTQYLLKGVSTVSTIVWMLFIVIYSSAELMSGSHNPFLYFRF